MVTTRSGCSTNTSTPTNTYTPEQLEVIKLWKEYLNDEYEEVCCYECSLQWFVTYRDITREQSKVIGEFDESSDNPLKTIFDQTDL